MWTQKKVLNALPDLPVRVNGTVYPGLVWAVHTSWRTPREATATVQCHLRGRVIENTVPLPLVVRALNARIPLPLTDEEA